MIEFKKYLPIGSVVLLKNANKRLMIYGRLQKAEDSDSVRQRMVPALDYLAR